jgi:hypothetical protein
MIEVKAFGTSNRGYELWLEARQVQEARTNPDFYVYVVENVRQGDSSMFTLRVLGGEHLARLVARAKEQQYFTIPWPVALEAWLTGTPRRQATRPRPVQDFAAACGERSA